MTTSLETSIAPESGAGRETTDHSVERARHARISGVRPARLPFRWFYVGMAAAASITTVVGFSYSYKQRTAAGYVFSSAATLHAALFFSWVGLFLAQTLLVATHRIHAHRRLGIATACVAAAMLVTAPPLAIAAAARGVFPGDDLVFLFDILVDLVCFGVFVVAGIYNRQRSTVHKRWMLLATTSLLGPAVSRLPIAIDRPGVIVGLVLLFLTAPILFDLLSGRRPHPVSAWGGLVLFVSVPLRHAVGQTNAWHQLATSLTR